MRNKDKIQFISDWEGMPEDLFPQPSRLEYPNWFKNMPVLTNGQRKQSRGGTVKRCPSFIEWFGQGYVLKMWSDVVFYNDAENWGWETPDGKFRWDIHPTYQFQDYLPHDRVNVVYKAVSPWKIITPKGWSCYELPLLFDYNNDWQVMAGINGTDTFHEWNTTIGLFGDKSEIFIPRGTPISQIVPFKRKRLKHVNQYMDKLDKETRYKLKNSQYDGRSMFTGSYKIGKYE